MNTASFYARNALRQQVQFPVPSKVLRLRTEFASPQESRESELPEDMKHAIMVERVAREVFDNLLFTDGTTHIAWEVRQALNHAFGEELLFVYNPSTLQPLILRNVSGRKEAVSAAHRAEVLEKAWNLAIEKVEATIL